mgnify:CR=1 FL=1
MYIKKIEWLNQEIKEAVVTISNDKIELKCFSHPFNMKKSDKITEIIECLSVNNIYISYRKEYYIEYYDGNLTYRLCGKLIDKKNGIMQFEDIKLYIGEYIPGDIQNDDYIIVTISRLDI